MTLTKDDAADDEEETLTKEHQEPLSAAYSRRMTLVNKDEPLPDGVGEEEGTRLVHLLCGIVVELTV